MTESVNPAPKPRVLTARRLVLLASVAGLGAAVLFAGASLVPKAAGLSLTTIAYAQGAQRPVGFADIVEKVKPAVISVRVKVDAGPQMMGFDGNMPFPPGSQMERFFRRFGMPDGEGGMPDEPASAAQPHGDRPGLRLLHLGRRLCGDQQPRRRQGRRPSRSPTDDGKTYTAKVIGTDPRTDLALIKVDGRNDFPFVKLGDEHAAHRRLGARGRQSVRPRRHRDGRHRLGARPRHRRRPL